MRCDRQVGHSVSMGDEVMRGDRIVLVSESHVSRMLPCL